MFKSIVTMLAAAAAAATFTFATPAFATPLLQPPGFSLLAPELEGQLNLNTASQASVGIARAQVMAPARGRTSGIDCPSFSRSVRLKQSRWA